MTNHPRRSKQLRADCMEVRSADVSALAREEAAKRSYTWGELSNAERKLFRDEANSALPPIEHYMDQSGGGFPRRLQPDFKPWLNPTDRDLNQQ